MSLGGSLAGSLAGSFGASLAGGSTPSIASVVGAENILARFDPAGTSGEIASAPAVEGTDQYTLAQATSSQRPDAVSDNGYPSWRFTRADSQVLTATGISTPGVATRPTLLVVFRRVTTSQNGLLVEFSYNGVNTGLGLYLTSAGNLAGAASTDGPSLKTSSAACNDSSIHLARVTVGPASTSVDLALDGGTPVTTAYAGSGLYADSTSIQVGDFHGSFGDYELNGHIYEIVVCAELTSDQITAGETFLKNKFGIS